MSETVQLQETHETQITEQSISDRLHDMANYAVYKACELVPDGAHKPLALLGSILSLGGVGVMLSEATPVQAAPEAPGFSDNLLAVDSSAVIKRDKYLRNTKCAKMDSLRVNQGARAPKDHDKAGDYLSVDNIEGTENGVSTSRQKFSWKHSAKNTVCALEVITRDHKAFFPKPDREGPRGGYFVDPSLSMADGSITDKGASEFILFLRRKKI